MGRLLDEPQRLVNEYSAAYKRCKHPDAAPVEKQIAKVHQGIARLIDRYAEGYLERSLRAKGVGKINAFFVKRHGTAGLRQN